MNASTATRMPSWSTVVGDSAATGVSATLLYAATFAAYATARTSIELIRALGDEALLAGTLLANAASITLAVTSTVLVLAPATACLGALSAAAVFGSLKLRKHALSAHDALWTGGLWSLMVVACLHAVVRLATGQSPLQLGVATYLFWLGLPALVHIAAGSIGAWYLNARYVLPLTRHDARTTLGNPLST